MPLVTIKAPENAFTPQQQREMLDRVTEAMIEVEGESFRDKTWVVYEEVRSGHWAIGGSIVGASGDE